MSSKMDRPPVVAQEIAQPERAEGEKDKEVGGRDVRAGSGGRLTGRKAQV